MTTWNDLTPYLADVLVIFGCSILTAGLIGLIRMPDIYTKIHAASKAVFLGAIVLLFASVSTHDPDIILRVALIAVALILTTPVASHVIAQSAAAEHELMVTEGALDESDYHLTTTVSDGGGRQPASGIGASPTETSHIAGH